MDETLLTVAEIAQKAGVSRQTVYNRAKGEWQRFTREVDSKLYISSEALTTAVNDSEEVTDDSSAPNMTFSESWANVVSELKEIIAEQKREIEDLRRRNRELEDLVKEKDCVLSEKNAHIEELSLRFADVAERAQELTRNAQTLHALTGAHEEGSRVESRPKQKRVPWWRRNADSEE